MGCFPLRLEIFKLFKFQKVFFLFILRGNPKWKKSLHFFYVMHAHICKKGKGIESIPEFYSCFVAPFFFLWVCAFG